MSEACLMQIGVQNMALITVIRLGNASASLRAILILVALVFPTSLVSFAADADSGETTDHSADIAFGDALASVNGVLIERAEFERNFARVADHSRAASASALALNVLHSMINQELVLQVADALDIDIQNADVDAEIARLQDDIVSISWEGWLEQNRYTESELRRAVYLQLLNNAVRDQVTRHLHEMVEHVHARHILAASAAQAQYVLARLEAGVGFGVLAAAVSVDVTTREQGGDLGWFTRGELLDDSLAEATFALAEGEVSGPIATRLGYHIVQKLGTEMRFISEERKPRLAESIFELWQEAQLEAAEIVLNLELLDAVGH